MVTHNQRTARGVAFLALVLAGCGGDDGPTAPRITFDVAGLWDEINLVTGNTCGITVPDTLMTTFELAQDGERIAITAQGITLEGTIDLDTGDFMLELETEFDGVRQVTVQSGRFSSSDAYTATTTFDFSGDVPACTITTADTGTRRVDAPAARRYPVNRFRR